MRRLPTLEHQTYVTYIGTTSGVYRLTDGGVGLLGHRSERISALDAWRDGGDTIVLAGSYGAGVYRSANGGRTWEPANTGLTASTVRCLAADPLQPGALLAGTEPARLFRSLDGGGSWQELAGITQIAGHERWFLPYSPRAGALRNVYAPPHRPGLLFAAVEVGGLLRSEDNGVTWACEPVIEDEDIHFITGQPQEPDLLYAALGYAALPSRQGEGGRRQLGGVARSRDGGKTWRKVETDYTRAVFVPPTRPDLVLAGPAPQVGQGGRIAVSADSGETWLPADAGLPTPMPDMVELFVAAPDATVWAICSGGRLLRSAPGEWFWRSALPGDTDLCVQSIAFASGDS
ncbi:MAG TPA: sialidase family protein [Chloroflexota bacterium]|nr:sialidase family protein [Chloroflexota bacterium]